jgi:ankyrin repeat protein
MGCTGPDPGAVSPISIAARTGDVDQIRALAATRNVNAFDPGRNHWTPLLHAIHKNQIGAIDTLIAVGADVNLASPGGRTPLLMAAGNGQADVVRRLLTAGANPRLAGDELFEVAVSGGALTDIENPLLGQCHTDVVRALLDRAPELRLRRNARGHLAIWFARLNNCTEVLALAKVG